jgi:hypothetical protein
MRRTEISRYSKLVPLLWLSAHCGAPPGPGDAPEQAAATGNQQGPTNPPASVGDTAPDFIVDPNAVTSPTVTDVPFDADMETCAEVVASSFRPTAVLEVVLDTSRSMSDPLPGTGVGTPSKLSLTVESLRNVITEMDDDTWVGLLNYPAGAFTPEQCLSGAEIAPPAALGAVGSAQRQRLYNGLTTLSTEGATPTLEALILGLRRLMNLNIAAKKYLVLFTDGAPSVPNDSCPTNGETDAQLYEAVDLAGRNGISLFVIGAPGSEFAAPILSHMATRGNTAREDCSDMGPRYCHYDLSQIEDLSVALTDALDEINFEATACSYQIPPPPAGSEFAPDRVNVRYFDSAGVAHDLLQDPSAACSTGWRYNADRVELCADSCSAVQANPNNTVEVLFGCQTRIVVK